MAVLTVTTITSAGVTRTLAAVAAGGDAFPNNGDTFAEIDNSSGSNSYTVTFVTSRTADGYAIADVTVTVGTSAKKVIGPFPKHIFNDGNGRVQITYSGSAPETDLTIAAYSLK